MWWLMVATMAIVAIARLRLLSFPLERDEGEYAYAGQLILQGIPPYELAYNMKFPGTYLAYAGIMSVFGQTPAGIHFGLLLMTSATALMLFWLGKKLLDETAGCVAAASYALLAAGPSMLGLAGHATQFCAFFATAGFCLMWRVRQKENWPMLAASGALFGTAVLMKQHAAIIAAWAGLSFAFGKFFVAKDALSKRLGSVTVYGFFMLMPLGLCCLWLWHAGVFETFKFWTFDYAREYASITSLASARGGFWNKLAFVMTSGILLWLLAMVGLVVIWLDPRWKNSRVWLFGFWGASALAVCPDFYFRPHYFLIAVPALALLAGAAVSIVRQWPYGKKYMPGIYVLMVAVTIATCAGPWFFIPKLKLARELYGFDPLPESEAVATFIRENSPPSARVAVLGSEPQIYFLSHRHSATGYIYIYALTEAQPFAIRMRREMIGELEAQAPEFIVVSDLVMVAARRADPAPNLFGWWNEYQTNYTRVGLADIISQTETAYAFGTNAVASHGKIHQCALEIFQRNPDYLPGSVTGEKVK
jgi:Dolichyl-phosphate-mannose-protein mannosyltransferase